MSDANLTAFLSEHDRGAMAAAAELSQALSANLDVTTAAGLAPGQVCQTYQGIRPSLEKWVPYLKYIPVVGSTAYAAVSGLMTLLDTLCGISR